jgi:hypothetical protein
MTRSLLEGRALVSCRITVTLICQVCGAEWKDEAHFWPFYSLLFPLPDGWDTHHGAPVCPLHRVAIQTGDPR